MCYFGRSSKWFYKRRIGGDAIGSARAASAGAVCATGTILLFDFPLLCSIMFIIVRHHTIYEFSSQYYAMYERQLHYSCSILGMCMLTILMISLNSK